MPGADPRAGDEDAAEQKLLADCQAAGVGYEPPGAHPYEKELTSDRGATRTEQKKKRWAMLKKRIRDQSKKVSVVPAPVRARA